MTGPNTKSAPNNRVISLWELTTQRLSLIRSLYIVSVAANGARDEVDAEFRQAVGDVLEGMSLTSLTLTLIDKNKVREEASWLQDRK